MTTQTPAVSVIVSFFDAEKFIEESIESVFSQTFKDWELLLVDDGSTDRSSEIARQLSLQDSQRIKYFEHPGHQNRGLPVSRNVGAASARGEYIAILDSDDVWLPGKLQEQFEIMKSHPKAMLVCGLTQCWYSWTKRPEDGDRDFVEVPEVSTNRLHEPPTLTAKRLSVGWSPPPSDLMIDRKALIRIGGFEESFVGIYGMYEDQALLTKLALNFPIFVSGQCWTKYRMHDDSICAVQSKAGNEPRIRKFYLQWLEKHLSDSGVDDREIWRNFRRARRASRYPKLGRAEEILRHMQTEIAKKWPGSLG